VNIGFIHPNGNPLFTQILNQPDDLLLVIPRVTDKNVRFHDGLLPLANFLHEFYVVGIVPMLDQQQIVSESKTEPIVLVGNFRLFDKIVYPYLE
jgi:hypothetical protein